ncbi:LamG-like jellyroll fold domain-containing protein [Azospirillum argentinense]
MITGSGELIVNGQFASDLAGWAVSGNATWVGGVAQFGGAAYGGIEQALTTVVGQTYLVPVTVGGGPVTVSVGTVAGATDVYPATNLPVGAQAIQFTATRTTTYLKFYKGSTTPAGTVDEVSCRVANPDRSYKGKGLAVNGTLQRNPAATGADVVAWSGFTPANNLFQPHSSDLDFGAEDFYICGLINPTAANSDTVFVKGLTTPGLRLYHYNNALALRISDGVNAIAWDNRLPLNTWSHFVAQRNGNAISVSINGVESRGTYVSSGSSSVGSVSVNQPSYVGSNLTDYFKGALTMIRVGIGYIPPAQVKRMARDELLMIQAGAKCLLGGTSNVVAALDRDPITDRLAVGTGDGVSIFHGLRLVEYLDESMLSATTSDTVRSVSLRGGSLLVGTAAEVGFVGDALGGKEAIAVGGPRPVGGGFTARGVTTDASPLDLAPRVFVGERETVLVEARIIGRVVGAADTERLSYVRRATYYRDAGGNVTLQGSVQTLGTDTEATSTADATLQIDTASQTVSARVTGVASKRIAWAATFTVTRLSEETSYAA